MVVMVIGVNVLFWRPLVAYAEKFRVETSEAAEQPKSYVLDFLRQSRIPSYIAAPLRPVGRELDRITRPFGLAEYPLYVPETKQRAEDVAASVVGSAVLGYGVYRAVVYFHHAGVFNQFGHCAVLGAFTFLRVVVLVV